MNSSIMGSLRRLARDRIFVGVNVLGLAFGFATAVALLLIVNAESGYDEWVKESDQIVRLHTSKSSAGAEQARFLRTPSNIAALLKADFPEIENVARIWGGRLIRLPEDGAPVYERIYSADPSFFDIFNWPILAGNMHSPLEDPNSITISKSAAQRIYGGAGEALGQVVRVCCAFGSFEPRDYKVTAVLDETPGPTHLTFDFLTSNPFPGGAGAPDWFSEWGQNIVYTYVKLKSVDTVESFSQELPNFVDRHRYANESQDPIWKASNSFKLTPMPLTDIHMLAGEHANDTISKSGNLVLINSLTIVAILVLAIAVANYINLTSVRLIQRTQELLLRKISGANNMHLALQFAGETCLITGLGLLFGLSIVELSLSAISDLAGLELVYDPLAPHMALSILGLLLLVVLASSIYPIFLLKRQRPAALLKSNKAVLLGGPGTNRNILVIGQFSGAICLIIATSIILMQTRFAMALQNGFNAENTIVVGGLGSLAIPATEQFKIRVSQLEGVRLVARSQGTPGIDDSINTMSVKRLNAPESTSLAFGMNHVDDGFFDIYQVKFLAGRNFDGAAFPGDPLQRTEKGFAGSAILNESGARGLGFLKPDDAIGTAITSDYGVTFTIVGITEDHHFKSTADSTSPYVFSFQPAYWSLSIRHDLQNTSGLIEEVGRIWRDVAPSLPFEYSFADESMALQYKDDRRQTIVLFISTLLAILTACLGLYGLVSFAIDRRTKEIGMRRVLGASLKDILQLLSWDFCKPILIANLIAWPLALYLMQDWLSGFAYRIDLNFTPFLVAGVATILIGWCTISFHIVNVARKSPIEALREV